MIIFVISCLVAAKVAAVKEGMTKMGKAKSMKSKSKSNVTTPFPCMCPDEELFVVLGTPGNP